MKFLNTGTCNWAVPNGVTSLTYLVVGGGGAGGMGRAGGGGAGGLLYNTISVIPNTLETITVGAGGTPGSWNSYVAPTNGGISNFGTSTIALGGGAGGVDYLNIGHTSDTTMAYGQASVSGVVGSGGGNEMNWDGQPPQLRPGYGTPGQGNNGATGSPCAKTCSWTSTENRHTGGGGGAGSPGVTGFGGDSTSNLDSGTPNTSGITTITPDGGYGLSYSITGSQVCYAGGGGGATGNASGEGYISTKPGHGYCGGGGGAAPGNLSLIHI